MERQTAQAVRAALEKRKNISKAKAMQRFFKTGKGEYGEGDVFLGISVPEQRVIARRFRNLPNTEVVNLLQSKIHEHRLTALIIWTIKFEKASPTEQHRIYALYLSNRRYINNWDLVDVTTPRIIGYYLHKREKKLLYTFARSKNLWEKRIAILATFYFIKNGNTKNTFALAKILLHDPHDLIQKAVGWMLREAGKVHNSQLLGFLSRYAPNMPRTMLRYSIERLPEKQRKHWLKVR